MSIPWPKICLLGDMVRQVIMKPIPEGGDGSCKAFTRRTGAPIVRSMIFEALEKKGNISDIIPDYVFAKDNMMGPQLINILEYYPRTSYAKEGDKVLRIKDGAEYFAANLTEAEHDCNQGSMPEDDKENSPNLTEFLSNFDFSEFNNPNAQNILVIYDRDSDLRKFINKDKDKIKSLAAASTGGVVIAIRDNYR